MPDTIRIVGDLAERGDPYGTERGIPGNGPLTADRLAEIASDHLGREVRVRAVSGPLLKLLSLVHPGLRAIRPMIPHYVRPVRYDTSKVQGLLGEVRTTPFEEAIPVTLDWIAEEAGRDRAGEA